MKILMCSSFLHHRGGDGTCMFGLTEGLRARGHDVIPFAMRHPENVPSPWETRFPPQLDVWGARGIERLLAVAASVYSVAAARALDALLADVRPDVAHIHHLHRHLTPSILRPLRRRGIPVVWTVHDYELICPNATLYARGEVCTRCRGHRYGNAVRLRCKRGDLAQSAAVAVEKWAHARLRIVDDVSLFLCPSRYLAERLVEFGFDPAKVLHVPNALPERPAGGPPGDYWLYAGRLSPEKGVEDLLAAARRLPARPLRVLGGGPELERLRRTAPANVSFHGQVEPAQVEAELRGAGVVVVPSRWPENFPYAVLEAQMAGRAVVASRVGGIPEQIASGVDGLLVEPGAPIALAEAVEGLFRDPVRAARLGEAARTRVRRERCMDPHLDSIEAIYRGLQ